MGRTRGLLGGVNQAGMGHLPQSVAGMASRLLASHALGRNQSISDPMEQLNMDMSVNMPDAPFYGWRCLGWDDCPRPRGGIMLGQGARKIE